MSRKQTNKTGRIACHETRTCVLYDCKRSNVQSNTNGENCWLSFIENLANISNLHRELSMKNSQRN